MATELWLPTPYDNNRPNPAQAWLDPLNNGGTSLSRLVVQGGCRLRGNVRIGGRKNSVVAVIPATIVCGGVSRLENIPHITDVEVFTEMLRELGADLEWTSNGCGSGLLISTANVTPAKVPYHLAKKLRASYYLLGALLGRFGEAEIPLPGGCDIGLRPIDQHVKGFESLGAEVTVEGGVVRARADRLVGTTVYLDVVSVGATINIMLAAVLAEGLTVIENAAKEPHIVDLANYLNACGARVQGAGTDVIRIRGVSKDEMHGATHAVIPDEIEAATFMIAACATHGDVTIENVIPKHLAPVSAKLEEIGANVWENGDVVRVWSNGHRPKAVHITTLPYPGFPTDAQQPMTSLLSVAVGTSMITETIWEGRFKHIQELNRMGTRIKVEGRTAIIEGVPALSAAPIQATDLRAAAALVVAGLMAEGETEISGVEHIDRGYDKVVDKLRLLGARVRREP